MGITYVYDAAEKVVHTRGAGVISTADIREYVLSVIHDEKVTAGFIEIFDMEQLDDLLVSYREILPFHDLWKDYLRKGCRGVVIYAPGDLSFGIMRMFQAAIAAEDQVPAVPFLVVRSSAELDATVARLKPSAG